MYIKRPTRPQTLQALFQNVIGSTGTPHTLVANNNNTITLARQASQHIITQQGFTKQPSSQQTHTQRHHSHQAWHLSSGMEGQGRSRRGGRGGGGGGQSRDVSISRALSRLLRHQAANAGIQLDGEGYAPLDKVVGFLPLPLSSAAVTPFSSPKTDLPVPTSRAQNSWRGDPSKASRRRCPRYAKPYPAATSSASA